MAKHSIAEVAEIVDSEGLGYAVLDAAKIADKKLAKAWAKAKAALDEIDDILNDCDEHDE